MKKLLPILLFVSFPVTSLLALDHHDQEAIKMQVNKGFQAVAKQDWETVESLCTDDWVHVNHMGMRWSVDEMKRFFADHISDHTIEISNINVKVSGDAFMAWATFDEKTSYQFDDNPVSESAVFTAIFVKIDDAWRMTALQRTIVQPPPDMSKK